MRPCGRLCNTAKQTVWIRKFLRDIGGSPYAGRAHATRILGDPGPEFHSRSKHIDVQHHYFRELLFRTMPAISLAIQTVQLTSCPAHPCKRPPLWVRHGSPPRITSWQAGVRFGFSIARLYL